MFFSDDGVLSLSRFSWEMLIFFVPIGGLIGNYIDLKDVEGDRVGGVLTLPVLIGLGKTKLIVSLGGILGFALLYFMMDVEALMYLVPLGLLLFLFLLNKKPFVERLFLASYVGMLLFSAAVMFSKNTPGSTFFDIVLP